MVWKKFSQYVAGLFGKNTPNNAPQDPSALILQEIDTAIEKNLLILKNTQTNAQEIAQKLAQYQSESDALHKEATHLLKRKQETAAANLLQKKNMIDGQLQQFQQLHANINSTVRKIEQQVADLQLQKASFKTKTALLDAGRQHAETEKELEKVLEDLDLSGKMDACETELLKMDLEAQLTKDFLETDAAFAQISQSQNLEQFKNELQQTELKAQQELAEAQFKKIAKLFETHNPNSPINSPPPPLSSTPKVEDFFQSVSPEPAKKALLDNFFETPAPEPAKTNPIDDFFNHAVPSKSETDKQKQIDDFFK
jgi:phage shock protein A